ncbi:hypothetical protein TNCV_2040201 [Trichonephila clavipes]|nr:hypothetical protein TNCV_2040201 [Trichonephila clavipes]
MKTVFVDKVKICVSIPSKDGFLIQSEAMLQHPKQGLFPKTGKSSASASQVRMVSKDRRECTMRYDWALRHTSYICLKTFRSIFAVTLSLVRSNSWDAQLAIPNDPRYARLETNMEIGQAKEG